MEVSKQKVYVVGHKSPDTDSVCSAIAYAYLKNKDNKYNYIPKRAGKLNEETSFVLQKFLVDEPEFLGEVGTQVMDMDIRDINGVSEEISLKRAWSLMRELNISTLPIVNQERLMGLITTVDIAESFMDIYDSEILLIANTHIRNIIETLDGEIIVGDNNTSFNKGKVLIAAANPDLMENYIEKGDLVILGNRYESQLCAIEMGASCIIVCDGAKVSATIQKIADSNNCTVISSPHDTFTVARLINQSMPIRQFMSSDNLITFCLDEYTEDIKETMGKYRIVYFPVVDKEGKYVGMISRRNFINIEKKKLVLVDHNDKYQSVENIDAAEILEIVDHHRLGSIETMNPVFFRNQPLGCTATIIFQMYREQCVEIPKEIAGLLCSAIISDTLLYSSPTCTEVDIKAAKELAKIADIDDQKYAIEMFKAGSNLLEKPAEDIFHQDFKKFNVNGIDLGIGQINTIIDSEVPALKEKILEYMNESNIEKDIDIIYFMITSIVEKSTTLIYYGSKSKEIAESAFDVDGDKSSMFLKGVMSRKKQVVPSIMEALQS